MDPVRTTTEVTTVERTTTEPTLIDTPLVYTVEEAAKLLKICRATMYVLLDKGLIVGFRPMGETRRRFIARTELERYVQAQTTKAHADKAREVRPELVPVKSA